MLQGLIVDIRPAIKHRDLPNPAQLCILSYAAAARRSKADIRSCFALRVLEAQK